MKCFPNYTFLFIIWLIVLLPERSTSQIKDSIDTGLLFIEARELAATGNYTRCRAICREINIHAPFHVDAIVLAARTFGWENLYDSARIWIKKALLVDEGNTEAIMAKADIEIWAGTPLDALPAVNRGLEIQPSNPDLLFKKARILFLAGNTEEARQALLDLKDTIPGFEGLEKMLELTRKKKVPSAVFTEYHYDHFNQPYNRRWHVLSAGLEAEAGKSRGILRLNIGNNLLPGEDFTRNIEAQAETDLYPGIRKGTYAYLNYGFSPGKYFPRHRTGAELFQDLPHEFVVSAGFRYLKWDTAFLFYTLSVEKYLEKYWFSFRPYVFHKTYGWSVAWFLTARRYLNNPADYLQVIAGTGTSPDEPIMATDLERLQSHTLRSGFQKSLDKHWIINLLAGYSRDQFAGGLYRNRWDLRAGLKYTFQ